MGAKAKRVRLKPKDSFDLIRLLAESQSDPRKAVAELVQNSLDAGAGQVEIRWFNEKGRRAIRVVDDGSGVFCELEREEALKKIATTIGHSHKRDLDPARRRELMMLGKYGIGLLGFWSLGQEMEIRSRVGGGRAVCLRMFRGRQNAEIGAARAGRLDEEETYTAITVRELHGPAVRQVRPRMLHPYLARELRGQLLGRDVAVVIRDKVARGRARKLWRVVAEPFLGQRIEHLTALYVTGHEPARLELYFVPADEERDGTVQLACGGATVLEDIAELDPGPWTSGRFEGVVDFADLSVAPGTRRGVVPDAACQAFLVALQELARELDGVLEKERQRREEERERNVARAIRRVFRSVARLLPEYDMFDLKAKEGARGEEAGVSEGEVAEAAPAPVEDTEPEEALSLYPPGPLAAVRIRPARARVAPGAGRVFAAVAEDRDQRRLFEGVVFDWVLEGPGDVAVEGASATYRAPPEEEATATLRVTARQGALEVSAEAVVRVEESAGHRPGGIPEPVAVHAPSEPWRSRMQGGQWQYNAGHRDYRAAADVEARRVRYLTHLFSKELVLRNFGRPADAEILERLVELLTYLGA